MFQDGFYKVQFSTPLGQGAGVALLSEGKLYGGDSMMAYVGKYSVNEQGLTAEVRVFAHTHTPGMQSALGTNAATLSLSGHETGTGAKLSGTVPQKGAKISLTLEPIN